MQTQNQSHLPQPVPLPEDFFTDLSNTDPYVKAGFEGFGGSGKSHTSALLAIGLWHLLGLPDPVILVETEKSGKYIKRLFDKHGVPVKARPTRSLADLKMLMQAMRNGYAPILMIDSIFHIYDGFVKAYKEKKYRNAHARMEMLDWAYIKPAWKEQFSIPYVDDPYHIIFTGRAGHEYDSEVDEETQKRQIFKSGVVMKGVGNDLAFEPHLLVLMEKVDNVLGHDKVIEQHATVLKDRSDLIHGKCFVNPTFEDFEPAIKFALGDPTTRKLAPEADNHLLIQTEENRREWIRQKEKALEEIDGLLVRAFPASTGKDRQMKMEVLDETFGTTSDTAIRELSIEELRAGWKTIADILVRRGIAEHVPAEHRLLIKSITPTPPPIVTIPVVETTAAAPVATEPKPPISETMVAAAETDAAKSETKTRKRETRPRKPRLGDPDFITPRESMLLVTFAKHRGWSEPEFVSTLTQKFGIAGPDFVPIDRYDDIVRMIDAGTEAVVA